MLCGDVRYFESASEGGTGASTGFGGKRRDRRRLTVSDEIERGRERGVDSAGECGRDIVVVEEREWCCI